MTRAQRTLKLVASPRAGLDDLEIGLLLEGIYRHYGFDFRDYVREPLRRRILERVRAEELRSVSGLQERVLHEPACFERLVSALAHHATTLFRNPAFYRAFRMRVLPTLKRRLPLRIWHMGCATGEDVFALSVLLHEEGLAPHCRVYATEIHEASLRDAARGAFPLERLQAAELSYRAAGGHGSLADHYRVEGANGIFREEIRSGVVFAAHNPATDASFNEFDVVLCRNVLPYLGSGLQARVQHLVFDSLASRGFLGLGRGEDVRLTPFEQRYRAVDAANGLFQKVR
jgi:chemotaxis protein methyltransferase CheR